VSGSDFPATGLHCQSESEQIRKRANAFSKRNWNQQASEPAAHARTPKVVANLVLMVALHHPLSQNGDARVPELGAINCHHILRKTDANLRPGIEPQDSGNPAEDGKGALARPG
jgi:hypothetical protein